MGFYIKIHGNQKMKIGCSCQTSFVHLPGCMHHGKCRFCMNSTVTCKLLGKCSKILNNPKRKVEHDRMFTMVFQRLKTRIQKIVIYIAGIHTHEPLNESFLQRINKLKEAYLVVNMQNPIDHTQLKEMGMINLKLNRILFEVNHSYHRRFLLQQSD
jgi:hypothetical protein